MGVKTSLCCGKVESPFQSCNNYEELLVRISNVNFRMATEHRKFESEGSLNDNFILTIFFYKEFTRLTDILIKVVNDINENELSFSRELCTLIELFYDQERLYRDYTIEYEKALKIAESYLKEVFQYGKENYKNEVLIHFENNGTDDSDNEDKDKDKTVHINRINPNNQEVQNNALVRNNSLFKNNVFPRKPSDVNVLSKYKRNDYIKKQTISQDLKITCEIHSINYLNINDENEDKYESEYDD